MPAGQRSDSQDMASPVLRQQLRSWLGLSLVLVTAACTSGPTVVPTAPAGFDQKVSWILRLENQRVLRDEVEPPAVVESATEARPVRTEVPDLVTLLTDPEPQLRR